MDLFLAPGACYHRLTAALLQVPKNGMATMAIVLLPLLSLVKR